MPALTPDQIDRVKAAWLAPGASSRVIARECGITPGAALKYRPKAEPEAAAVPQERFEERADGTATLAMVTEKPIRTLAQLTEACEVDESVWYVERWECSAWTVPVTMGPKDDRKAVQTQQWRVKASLRRIVPRALGEAIEGIYERMRAHAPKYAKPARAKPGECMAVFGLFDAHFGKLAWKPETGSSYDLKIAEQVFRNAASDLLAECGNRSVGKIVLPIGNDFFHVDNKRNTTFQGTPQDVDGRYAKVFEAGLAAVVWAVEELASVAPVDVVWVPGNHDPTVSYHLAKTVEAWFRRNDRVRVDAGPRVRKYLTWGANLLGLTHGDAPKAEDLPGLMAAECRAEWATATCCEWLIGHMHRSRSWVSKGTDSHKGTVVRTLRALCGTDAWHYANGYVGSEPAAEVYWYGRERGYMGHAVVPARGA